MKNLLLITLLLLSTVVFAQKNNKLQVNLGASLFAPVTKSFDWDNKAWGQRIQLVKPRNEKVSYTLTFGIQQSKDDFLQMPLLLGGRIVIYENLFIGLNAGTTFFKNDNPRFTLSPSFGVTMKRFTLEQSLFRTSRVDQRTLDGTHLNYVGTTLYYRL